MAMVSLIAGEIDDCKYGIKPDNAVHGLDDVGSGLAENYDQNARLAVDSLLDTLSVATQSNIASVRD